MVKAHALIIGDNINNAKYLAKTLAAHAFRCQFVMTGSQAQIQLAFTTPDLIVLNPDLPDIPAEVILRQVKAHRRLRRTPLLVLETGKVQPAELQEALNQARRVNSVV